MKTITRRATLAAVLTIAVITVGCAQLDRALIREQVTPAQTVQATNSAGQVEIVTLPPVTNYVLNPVVAGTASVASALPIPWAGTIATLVGLLASLYVSARRKKLSIALVEGIEAGRVILQTTPAGQVLDAKIKDELIHHQELSGVLGAASRLVSTYTANTVK